MSKSPLQKAVEAAFKVFSHRPGSVLTLDSLSEVRMHLNQVTKDELKIDSKILENRILSSDEPPVTYIRILEDKLLTVAVFVLRQGKRLPLHDHPEMFGLLKVVHGKVTIHSYTPLDESEHTVPKMLTDELVNRYRKRILIHPTKFEGIKVCSEYDDCSVITPKRCGIHEIHAESETAAFLDILSPPYEHGSRHHRTCHYFKELRKDNLDESIRYLVQIKPPQDYWCDESQYAGPVLCL